MAPSVPREFDSFFCHWLRVIRLERAKERDREKEREIEREREKEIEKERGREGEMKSAPEKVTAAEAALAAPDAVQLVAAASPPQDFEAPAQQPRRPCCRTVALVQHPGGDIP